MNLNEKMEKHTFLVFMTKIIILMILTAGLIFATYYHLKSQIEVEAPVMDLGRKVIVQLPNGREIQTYENLLVERDGKLYYEGEFNTINVTGGIVVVQDWN